MSAAPPTNPQNAAVSMPGSVGDPVDDDGRPRRALAILWARAMRVRVSGLRQGQRMARTRWELGAVVSGIMLAAALGLGGCTTTGGTDSGPSTSPSTGSVTTPVASTSAVPTSSSTSTTATVLPLPVDLPAAAKEHSAAGAEAFVRFFYRQMNRAWTEPTTGLIPPLCLSSSKSCSGIEDVAIGLRRDGHRYSGDPLTISTVVPLGAGSPSSLAVDVRGQQERRDVLDMQGKVVLTDSQKPAHFEVQLVWFQDGWRVATIKGVD